MRRLAKASLATALLAGAALAEPSNSWSEQWFRAKFGHSSPVEEARMKAEAANTAYREDTTTVDGGVTKPQPYPFEQVFKAKYGRYSPIEENRRTAETANTAFRDDPSTGVHDQHGWTHDFVKAKYGWDLLKR